MNLNIFTTAINENVGELSFTAATTYEEHLTTISYVKPRASSR